MENIRTFGCEAFNLFNTCFSSFVTAINTLPINKEIRFETRQCLDAFRLDINREVAYYDLEHFPDICSSTVGNMIRSITTLKHPEKAVDFMQKTRALLVSKLDTESIVAEFAKHIITKSVRSREASTSEHLDCILGRLKALYSELKYLKFDAITTAKVIAKEINDIVHGFRVDSTETELADLSIH